MYGEPGFLHQIQDDRRVHIACPSPHDEPLKRREPHRRIYRHAVFYRGNAAAVSEMAGDEAQSLKGLPQPPRRLIRDESMARPVKAVSPDLVSGVKFVGEAVEKGVRLHRLMERCVEYGNLRHAGKKPACRPYPRY